MTACMHALGKRQTRKETSAGGVRQLCNKQNLDHIEMVSCARSRSTSAVTSPVVLDECQHKAGETKFKKSQRFCKVIELVHINVISDQFCLPGQSAQTTAGMLGALLLNFRGSITRSCTSCSAIKWPISQLQANAHDDVCEPAGLKLPRSQPDAIARVSY